MDRWMDRFTLQDISFRCVPREGITIILLWQEPIPTAASSSLGKLTSATSPGGSLARTTAPASRLPSLPDYGNDSLHSNSSSQPVGKRLVASQNDKVVVVVTHRMTDSKVLTTEASVNYFGKSLTYSVMCAMKLFPSTERCSSDLKNCPRLSARNWFALHVTLSTNKPAKTSSILARGS